jgi:hypothetical protein
MDAVQRERREQGLPPLPEPPRSRRLDLRVLLGIVVLLVGIGGFLVLWLRLNDTRPVLVAARELPAGPLHAG